MKLLAAAAQTAQPDYVALAMVLALAVVVLILAVRKGMKKRTAPSAEHPVETPVRAVAPGSAGQIKLHDVEPRTAAMVMAIVADNMGKPLNDLRFISIREVK